MNVSEGSRGIAVLLNRATVGYRRFQAFQAALPDAGRYAKSSVRRCFVSVGDTGLEPVTSSVSCWRASQLRQSPFIVPARIIARSDGASRGGATQFSVGRRVRRRRSDV